MAKMNDGATVTARPYGGYALTKVSRAGGDETPRFEAVLCRVGQPVAHVSNGGEGGAHRWSPVDEDGWEAIDGFHQYAAAWNAGSEFAGWADGDQLINRLVMVDTLNRARATAFLLDGEDFWQSGEHSTFRGATREQTLEALRSIEYARLNPRAWSKVDGDFVPVV
jgi:hypothetical protein